MTSPSIPSSSSGFRTSTTSAPSRRSIAACSRKLPCTARTPIRSASLIAGIVGAVSGQPVVGCPARELVARRELELPEDARDVALDGLRRQGQASRDLLVEVAAGDELQHLALARGELVELGVAPDALAGAEGVEHEAREARREDGVALRDALDRGCQLLPVDRLRHVSARAGAAVDDGGRAPHAAGRGTGSSTAGRSAGALEPLALPGPGWMPATVESAITRWYAATAAGSIQASRWSTKTASPSGVASA